MTPNSVLVAVADDDTRTSYATALRHGGYVALEARNVSEALGLITWHKPAAVISGPMTGPGGEELLQCLRQHPMTAAIPVIPVTADAAPRSLGRDRGAPELISTLKGLQLLGQGWEQRHGTGRTEES